MARFALIALVAMMLNACVAQGPKFESAAVPLRAGEAVIYVYRPKGEWVLRGENPYIEVDGEGLGQLRSGGYLTKVVPAGDFTVRARQSLMMMPIWSNSVDVSVAAGGSAYVKVDQRYTQFGLESGVSARQQLFIEEIDSLAAQAEIAQTRGN